MQDQIVNSTDIIPVFKLPDSQKYYKKTLEDLGVAVQVKTQGNRPKISILAQFEGTSAHIEGKEIILVSNRVIVNATLTAAEKNYDDEGFTQVKEANII